MPAAGAAGDPDEEEVYITPRPDYAALHVSQTSAPVLCPLLPAFPQQYEERIRVSPLAMEPPLEQGFAESGVHQAAYEDALQGKED